jgi:hypothetical protein
VGIGFLLLSASFSRCWVARKLQETVISYRIKIRYPGKFATVIFTDINIAIPDGVGGCLIF